MQYSPEAALDQRMTVEDYVRPIKQFLSDGSGKWNTPSETAKYKAHRIASLLIGLDWRICKWKRPQDAQGDEEMTNKTHSDNTCQTCGRELEWDDCLACCGDNEFCDICGGDGGWLFCPHCSSTLNKCTICASPAFFGVWIGGLTMWYCHLHINQQPSTTTGSTARHNLSTTDNTSNKILTNNT